MVELLSCTPDEVRSTLVTCPIVGVAGGLCQGDECMAWTWVDEEVEACCQSGNSKDELEPPAGEGWQSERVKPYVFPYPERHRFYQHWYRPHPARRGCCGMVMRVQKKEGADD